MKDTKKRRVKSTRKSSDTATGERELPPEVEKAIRAKVDADAAEAHPLAQAAYVDAFRLYLNNNDELKVARRCVEIYNDAGQSKEGLHFFLEHGVDPVMTNSGDNIMVASPNHELFTFLFVRAAREFRAEESPNEYTNLLDIIRRLEAGERLEDMRAERERELKEFGERRRAEQLAAPEPEDKTSAEWRYWKLRRLEAALKSGDDKETLAALDYFRELLRYALRESSIFTVSNVRELLPGLIILWQTVEKFDEPKPRRKTKKAA